MSNGQQRTLSERAYALILGALARHLDIAEAWTVADMLHTPDDTGRTYTSAQAVNLTGVTYRQLDYWCRVGYIQPVRPANGSGTRRRFSDGDLALIRAVVALVGIGVTPAKAFDMCA